MADLISATPVAVVGIAAIMPQAPDAEAFWANIKQGRYSITDVPPERWDPALYFSPDHAAPDKTYSKIGGWVREFHWDPVRWKLPIPPKVAQQMDLGQQWAVSAARAALMDAGWPQWKIDSDRVAVILGNAIGGEKHYRSSMRIELPEVLVGLANAPSMAGLPADQRQRIVEETRAAFQARCFDINEDTMPGELSNVMAGRIANLFNLRGPNFTTDAACASGLAALNTAVDGLIDHRFDAVITGGVDRNMAAAAFVKFCKIGALSATGTRPFDAGADGFVMGEGAALYVLKRLEDAERDGDRIYAVILGVGGSSDGKGKGITAPNPVGQKLAVQRAWEQAGADPATVSAIEAHGTSTSVGDAAELESLTEVFGAAGAPRHGVALGSVKSNIGHLKAAAGTAGLFKMVRSVHEKVLAPSLNFRDPNPNVDWDRSPFRVNTELREWPTPPCGVRRGGVSAFGFGGTNFHVVVEEHVPGRYKPARRVFASAQASSVADQPVPTTATDHNRAPLRGALVLGGRDDAQVVAQLQQALAEAKAGRTPAPARPGPEVGAAAVRVAVDFTDAADLATKLDKLLKAFAARNPAAFKMMRQQGAFVGRGPAPKLAFLYTGQGSQYVNMLAELRAREPLVAAGFERADKVMTPLLGRPLDLLHLHRRAGPGRRVAAGDAAAPDRNHAAGAAGCRFGPAPPAGVLRHATRHGDGPQPGRIRRADGRRLDELRDGAGSGQRTRPRDGPAFVEDNGAMAAVAGPHGRDRAHRPQTPGLRGGGQHQFQQPGRDRRGHGSGDGSGGGLRRCRHAGRAHSGQPRLPHVHRGARGRAAESHAGPPGRQRAAHPDGGQRDGRVLRPGCQPAADGRDPGPAGGLPGAVRQGPAYAVRRRCPRVRRGRPQACAARIRRRRAGHARRRAGAVHQPPQAGRHRRFQPGAVRPVGRRIRLCGPGTGGRRLAAPRCGPGRRRRHGGPPVGDRGNTVRSACHRCRRAADDRIVQLGRLFAGVLEQGLRLYGVDAAAGPQRRSPALPAPAPAGARRLQWPPPSRW
jgi:3-oxoacyl-(acyl-carrier-protein) synthase